MGLSFGVNYILPLLPEFLGHYPRIRADWQFDNRVVDLIAEGFDAAIGGGFDLPPAVISRVLAPLHIIAVASPDYMKGRNSADRPDGPFRVRRHCPAFFANRPPPSPNHAQCYRHRASSCIERNNCCERSRGNVSGGCAQSWRRTDFYAGSAALLGEQCARAPRPKLVCRSRFDLTVLSRPARCCRPKRASLSISSWRLFGGIAWPNASREVSDRTCPIVLASLITPQRNRDGRPVVPAVVDDDVIAQGAV